MATNFDPEALYVDADGDLWFADAEGYWKFVSCIGPDARADFSGGRYSDSRELVLNDPVRLRGVPARVTRAWLETAASAQGIALYGQKGQKPSAIGRFIHLDHS